MNVPYLEQSLILTLDKVLKGLLFRGFKEFSASTTISAWIRETPLSLLIITSQPATRNHKFEKYESEVKHNTKDGKITII